MASSGFVAGIDFGGTSVKVGVVDEDGRVRARDSLDLNPRASAGQILDNVAGCLERLLSGSRPAIRIDAVGIGNPGFTDKSTGVLIGGCPNIPTLQGSSVQAFMAQRFGVPAFADNDATCAAGGELAFGAGRAYANFALITLGTAIGGGLVLDGRIYRGARGFAAELGHICLDCNGPWCECGSRGCFEQYASATAIVRGYAERCRKRGAAAENLSARDVVQRACAGDRLAVECLEEAAGRIAQAFGTLCNILNLEACIIGGGLSQAGDVLLEPVRRRLADFTWPVIGQGVKVIAAELRNDAGILGAAAQVMERSAHR